MYKLSLTVCEVTIIALFNHWNTSYLRMFVVSCSYFPKLKCQNMSRAVKQDLAQQHSKIRHSCKKNGIVPCKDSSETVSSLGNRRLNFSVPSGNCSSLWPCPRTSHSKKHRHKMGSLDGFAVQQVPYIFKVWRSAVVRWRGGAGLAHPSWCDTGQRLRAFWCPKLTWEKWQCPRVSNFAPPSPFLVVKLLGMSPYPSGFMLCLILKEIKISISELLTQEISTGIPDGMHPI